MVIFALAVKEKRTAVTTVARRIFLEIKIVRLSLHSHAWRQLSNKVLPLPRNVGSFFLGAGRELFTHTHTHKNKTKQKTPPPKQFGLMKDVNCCVPQV